MARPPAVSPGKPSPAALLRQEGFTLIELLVAIIIVAVLAAILLPDLFGSNGSAQDTRARAALDAAKGAVTQYYMQNGESFSGLTPAKLEALVPTLHESKPPTTGANDEGTHDPLEVAMTVSNGGDVNTPSQLVMMCAWSNGGTAVYAIWVQPKAIPEGWGFRNPATAFSEGKSPSQTCQEVMESKGTNSYSKAGFNAEGW